MCGTNHLDRRSGCPDEPFGTFRQGNSTPIEEYNLTVGGHGVGNEPYGVAYDPENGYTYIANEGSSNVTILNGSRFVANVAAGSQPEGAFYDPANGAIYISNRGGDSLSVINGTKLATTISSTGEFKGPYDIAYDPITGALYVPNVDSNPGYVTVIPKSGSYSTVNTGTYPAGAAYDPADHFIYVTNAASSTNGGSSVTVINGTTVVTTIKGSFSTPIGVTYDPANGYMYVANSYYSNPSQGSVTVIRGTSVLTTLTVGGAAWDVVYDPVDQWIYSANEYGSSLSLISGTTVLHTVDVASGPYNLAIDNASGDVLVPEGGSSHLTILGEGALSIGPTTLSTAGRSISGTEVGVPLDLNTSVPYPGQSPVNLSTSVDPDLSGLGCSLPASFNASLPSAGIGLACLAYGGGNFTVWENLTDATNHTVSSWVTFEVYPNLNTPLLSALVAGEPLSGSVDANESFNLSAAASGGSGIYTYRWTWTGQPTNACGKAGEVVGCRFADPGFFDPNVTVLDTAGGVATSLDGSFVVDPALAPQSVEASPAISDSGQLVTLSESPAGGSGTYVSYDWSGLPASECSNLTQPSVTCTLPVGPYSGSVIVGDTNLERSSIGFSYSVEPSLLVGPPTASRTAVDVGQSLVVAGNVSGGALPYAVQWTGLPNGCVASGILDEICAPGSASDLNISYKATDASGTSVGSTTLTILVSPDPTVSAPTIAPAAPIVDRPVILSVTIGAGAGGDAFVWSGLPAGCASTNGPVLNCTPTATGSSRIEVTVTDRNGVNSTSPAATLVVGSPTKTTPAPGSELLGLPPVAFYAIVAGIAIAVVGVLAGFLLSRRRTPPPPARPARRPTGAARPPGSNRPRPAGSGPRP